jgi:RNA polymerase sigma-70 factor (ECF subfamily)
MSTRAMSGVEDLLGHERWVRRLARALTADEDEAEDVVQEARLASWRHPPREPRLWLSRVVRNLVRNRARARTRRARLHEAWSPAEAPSSPEQLGERLEAHRGLAEAVARLPDAFRDVVLLRYYEELNSTEIAARLGVPAGTVRWRLKEAIDRLRTDLDEHPRSRRWIALLAAPRLRRRPVLAASAAVVLAGVSALVVGGAFGQRPGHLARHPAASPMPRPPSLAGGEDLPVRTQLEGAPLRGIAGRVSSQGRPVPGAELRLSSARLPMARELDRRQQTGKDGAFAFPPQPPTGWYLTASAPGLEPRVLYLDLRVERPTAVPGGQAIEALVIDLPPCLAFASGLVRDDSGGSLVGARVRVTAAGNNGGTGEASDGSGRYRICLPTVPGGSYALVAELAGYGALETRAPDRSATVDFTLAPQLTLTGRAVLDDDGQPVPWAQIALVPLENRPPAGRTQPVRTVVRADEDGRFELSGLAPGRYDLRATSDEAMRVAGDVLELAPGERHRDLEVRLFPVAEVEGVTFRAGRPAPEAELLFRSRPSSPRRLEGAWVRSNAQGRFRVRLPRDADLEIVSPDPAGPAGPGCRSSLRRRFGRRRKRDRCAWSCRAGRPPATWFRPPAWRPRRPSTLYKRPSAPRCASSATT